MGFEWWFDGFIWIFGGLKAKIRKKNAGFVGL
jgi:hypothetical protein